MNLGEEEFLTPVTASYYTRVKESASTFILVVAMTIYIMISCFQIEHINLVEGMSCIAYVYKCVLLSGKRYDDVDFDRERYVAFDDFEACVFHYQNQVPEISENFFGAVDGLVTAYDEQHYFCSCSNCIIETRTKYSIEKQFTDGKHEECLDEIDTHFNERIEKEIRGQYIFQVWDLCRNCLPHCFYTIKGDFVKLFYLNI